ncbi:LuxR family transcriptional regulator [Streptomyces sp. NBC_00878]|uniref:LuxR family transcriptional regulator n=1 Tax=Streptomyces sp. NBC_00878 TaxID=2975854 RepID=UPI002254F7B9|nr:LuxR family transcriptional regulator [Streptomyces sp. NBC_00878]MCX4902866.1 LuxR C-terminal-related transcriptional regulator [Streptomyces sp. NBC_00878]
MKALYAWCQRGSALSVILEGGVGCGKTRILDLFAQYCAEQGATVLTIPRTAPAGEAATAHDVEDFVDRLEDLSRDAPIVVCRDDPQGQDEHGTRLLLDALRRLGNRRVMLVLTLLPFGGAFAPALHRDLLRQPHVHWVRLRPLTVEQGHELWTWLRGSSSLDSVEEALTASGGNPLLLRALSEELRMALSMAQWPQPHGLFVQEAVDCARDSGPLALKVAAGMAVLGEFSDPDSLAAVLRLSPTAIDYGRNLLDAAGLVRGWHIRHPLVAAGILEHVGEAQRAGLDAEAGELLYRRGTGATELARLLLRTRAVGGTWQAAVLERAAAEALDEDDARFADDCLALAQEDTTDCRDFVRLVLKRYVLSMRTEPWTAAPRFLDQSMREPCPHGHEPCHARSVLRARLLLECGRMEEGVTVLRSTFPQAEDAHIGCHDPESDNWPWLFQVVPGLCDTSSLGPGAGQSLTDLLKFDFCLSRLSARSPETHDAEEHLRTLALGDTTFPLIVSALICLSRGRPHLADAWAAHFIREATERGVEGWRQIFTGVRAEVALVRGRLTEAETYARDVLAAGTGEPSYWLYGSPLAVLIDVCVATGRYEEATRLLDRPLPDDFAQSVFSFSYLQARGHFLAGIDRPHLALSDFLTIGKCAERWLLPDWFEPAWRIDAAETWLRIGNDQECAHLLAAHEARASDNTGMLFPGQWLRVRARLAGQQERPVLLSHAVERLREISGGWVLADALADLAEAYQDLGQTGPAELVLREAGQLAEESRCGALLERIAALTVGDRPAHRVLHGPRSLNPAAKLSESELRVAVLAARGSTNREISEELFITVSTVEQHLTRVYRKLDITSRQELPLYVKEALREAA